jgi:hypothetical protein
VVVIESRFALAALSTKKTQQKNQSCLAFLQQRVDLLFSSILHAGFIGLGLHFFLFPDRKIFIAVSLSLIFGLQS